MSKKAALRADALIERALACVVEASALARSAKNALQGEDRQRVAYLEFAEDDLTGSVTENLRAALKTGEPSIAFRSVMEAEEEIK